MLIGIIRPTIAILSLFLTGSIYAYSLKPGCTLKDFELNCGPNDRHTIDIGLDSGLEKRLATFLRVLEKASLKPDVDLPAFKKELLKKLEAKFRYQFPSEEDLIKKALADLEKALNQELDCEEEPRKEGVAFVDLTLDQDSSKKLVRAVADAKMKDDGFFRLGELESLSITLDTHNDNFLHGGGSLMLDRNKNRPWWEGDDRGFTFGEKLKVDAQFENGAITASQYSRGYSSLAKVCAGKICQEVPVYFYRDKDGKVYQKSLTIDGLELEYRRNALNGDVYFKLKGSGEILSDQNGIAQVIQNGWHKMAQGAGIVQYNDVDFTDTKVRVQVGGGVGIKKDKELTSWLAVRSLVEGELQVSTDGLSNSYVAVHAEAAVDTGSLLRKRMDQSPILEARIFGDVKAYGNGTPYFRVGVRLTGNVYQDKSGNIVRFWTGIEHYEDPQVKEFGVNEHRLTGRFDFVHNYGLSYEKHWK